MNYKPKRILDLIEVPETEDKEVIKQQKLHYIWNTVHEQGYDTGSDIEFRDSVNLLGRIFHAGNWETNTLVLWNSVTFDSSFDRRIPKDYKLFWKYSIKLFIWWNRITIKKIESEAYIAKDIHDKTPLFKASCNGAFFQDEALQIFFDKLDAFTALKRYTIEVKYEVERTFTVLANSPKEAFEKYQNGKFVDTKLGYEDVTDWRVYKNGENSLIDCDETYTDVTDEVNE